MGATCSKDDGMAIDGSTTSLNQNHSNDVGHDNPYQQQQLQLQQQQQRSGSCLAHFLGCSSTEYSHTMDPRSMGMIDSSRSSAIDPVMYDLCKRSLKMTLQDEAKMLQQQDGENRQEAAPSSNHSSSNSNSKNASNSNTNKHSEIQKHIGQYHLLYKHQSRSSSLVSTQEASGRGGDKDVSVSSASLNDNISTVPTTSPYSTRLIVRRRPMVALEEGSHGTHHLYAVRYPPEDGIEGSKTMNAGSAKGTLRLQQEQCPATRTSAQKEKKKKVGSGLDVATEPAPEPRKPSPAAMPPVPTEVLTDFFQPLRMNIRNNNNNNTSCKETTAAADLKDTSNQTIQEWVTVSEEYCIYVVDVGLTPLQCDRIVQVTEHVCRGQYAAYTYAKQTLGCREFPLLAQACAPPVQAVVQAILGLPAKDFTASSSTTRQNKDAPPKDLQLDDREPHLVKYDVTKKERQKLDMHTDKSEWTFLIALSNGCGLDYDGGGTYFECLNATVHVQRGHALIFPGKLRHCGQRITRGLRYLLVGFLVDKAQPASNTTSGAAASGSNAAITGGNNVTASAKGKEEDDDDAIKTSGNNITSPVSARTLTSSNLDGDTIDT